MDLNRRLPRIDTSRFAMVPRPEIPRATFFAESGLKTTFQTGYLVPFYIDEVLPADVHKGKVDIFARVANMIFPIMDHMTLETFFFFAPARLLATDWKRLMGERANPADSISFLLAYIDSPLNGFPINSIFDYFGLPTVGQVTAGERVRVNSLPLRAYNFIWNEWFRDQNLQNQVPFQITASSEPVTDYVLLRRNKRPDYFTTALPWPLKGGVDVTLPLAGKAWVKGIASDVAAGVNAGPLGTGQEADGTSQTLWPFYFTTRAAALNFKSQTAGSGSKPDIYADMSSVTGATINALRLAFQTQRLLERDARSGTRYTELLKAHFGVEPEDTRLQRPEYIGGGRTSVQTQAVPQTSATGLTGGTSPAGSLSGQGTIADAHSFSYYAKEHGYIIGLVHVTGDITYQQGLRRLWTRQTRYDFYWPVFAHLGEQAIRNDELYCTGTDATDTATFGYQERWAEYRYHPSMITGLFRNTHAGSLGDTGWHIAQEFTAQPTLNSTFIEDNPPLVRALTAGAAADNMQIQMDAVFKVAKTRAMPMYSVPGNVDRF